VGFFARCRDCTKKRTFFSLKKRGSQWCPEARGQIKLSKRAANSSLGNLGRKGGVPEGQELRTKKRGGGKNVFFQKQH